MQLRDSRLAGSDIDKTLSVLTAGVKPSMAAVIYVVGWREHARLLPNIKEDAAS